MVNGPRFHTTVNETNERLLAVWYLKRSLKIKAYSGSFTLLSCWHRLIEQASLFYYSFIVIPEHISSASRNPQQILGKYYEVLTCSMRVYAHFACTGANKVFLVTNVWKTLNGAVFLSSVFRETTTVQSLNSLWVSTLCRSCPRTLYAKRVVLLGVSVCHGPDTQAETNRKRQHHPWAFGYVKKKSLVLDGVNPHKQGIYKFMQSFVTGGVWTRALLFEQRRCWRTLQDTPAVQN